MDDKTIQRFWSKVDMSGDCWKWTGYKSRAGYGRIRIHGKQIYAHRLAYELIHGPIPEGVHICHSCDNPPCCNPAHLWAGSPADNMADRDRKGRGGWGLNTTPEQRAMSSEHAKMQWADPEMRAKMIAANRAASRQISPEAHARRSQNLLRGSIPGSKWTDERRAQYSRLMKERMNDPNTRARISATLKAWKRKVE